MELTLGTVLAALAGLYFLYKAVSFARFYIIGRRTGFPLFVTPLFTQHVLWMFVGPTFQPQLRRYLPRCLYEHLDITIHGWEFRHKNEMHRRFGKIFAIVSPDECSLWIADPTVASTVLQRRKDFVMPPVVAQFIGFFGPNLLQSNGDDWTRMRRIIAPNLNEAIMDTVWNETSHQAQSMLGYLLQHPGGKTLSGLRSVAINVIGQAGYGQNQPWSPDFMETLGEDWEGARVSYFKTIAMVADRFFESALIPGKLKTMPFMPKYLRLLGRQMANVPQYIKEILDDERNAKSGESPKKRSNLLDLLVQFSDPDRERSSSSLFLTGSEISGNLWVFTGAGFDTTANTMGYAVILLAMYPQWQDWMREELRGLDTDVSNWGYDVFSRCPRVLAVMFETLRLFTPVPHATRSVATTQQVADGYGVHVLSSPMTVFVSQQSIHADADIWGADVDDFRPTRWLDEAGQVVVPPKGTFLPWSGGPRVCPGQKMSQVEFVATVATLFRHTRCEPLPQKGMTAEELQARLKELMEDSAQKLTIQVRRPNEVQLQWVQC
ncbi:cytochrome P450 [Aspergillus sclerotioniger CBS 115572]|uniref:Cytochrome P450 n=1 Tax=Aspergillus sclerotioniger CBS 115572 TaxID=1450535 RepID=A0A317WB19_9EURO|nr:cytochrome P450 [Aspergillus sclerotioniger CBS 115572]PWY83684.1 cytochrome P450 [Aspergillus sclerotioniger CBS 115572]